MLKDDKIVKTPDVPSKKPIILTFIGAIITILLILATLDISRRNLNTFVTDQQKYVLAIEAVILFTFLVEMLARLVNRLKGPQFMEHGTRLRLIVRLVGYSIALLAVVAILSSNAALGISVGAIVGVVVAFAAQSVVGSILAAIVILSTRMVRIGEEITISQTTGIVADINLTHTVISIDKDIVFVPNSLIISSLVRRKKRNSDKHTDVHDW